ncbi:MAG: hypothetical protein ABL911_03030 [Gallionella sp.]
MQFKSIVTVTGLKKFKGDVEGNAYDSTTAYIQMDMDESKKTARGFATQDYNIGTSEEFDKLNAVPLPFQAEATFEMTTNGKTQRQRVLSLVPRKQ